MSAWSYLQRIFQDLLLWSGVHQRVGNSVSTIIVEPNQRFIDFLIQQLFLIRIRIDIFNMSTVELDEKTPGLFSSKLLPASGYGFAQTYSPRCFYCHILYSPHASVSP